MSWVSQAGTAQWAPAPVRVVSRGHGCRVPGAGVCILCGHLDGSGGGQPGSLAWPQEEVLLVLCVSGELCLVLAECEGCEEGGAAGLGTGSISVGVGLEETQDWKFLVGAGPQRGPRWWPLRRRWQWGLALASWGAIQGKDV